MISYIEIDGVAHIAVSNDQTSVSDIPHSTTIEEWYIPEGVTKICDGAFRACHNLKKVHFPASLTYLGDQLFSRKIDHEIEIIYAGTSESFLKLGETRDVYIPGPYDHYPYYSSYGATCHTERFYALYDNYDHWCEVWCEADKVRLYYGGAAKDSTHKTPATKQS